MHEIPDVIGLYLQEAMKILNSEFKISIKNTKAPKIDENLGECRVIKQENCDCYVELTISYF